MENETFAETIERVLCNFHYDPIIGFGNTKNFFDDIYISVINSFTEHGNFLNVIPINDRERIISDDILTWMIRYSENDVNMQLNRLCPHKGAADRKRNKIIKTIKDFEEMILDNFSYLEVSINLNKEFDLENDGKDIKNFEAIKRLLATTETLKNDLAKGEYKIFPKNNFLPFDRVPKTELTTIIDKLIKDYNIKGYSLHKDPLINTIITL
nr:hypothetical protein 13 [Campylobacterota bacterium]